MFKYCACNSCCYFISLFALGLVCITVILSFTLGGSAPQFVSTKDPQPHPPRPLAINTWPFTNATAAAWNTIVERRLRAVDAVEIGCSVCEEEQCDFTVGYGGSPDENGETTLDAFIMDGMTMNVGAVAALRGIKQAIAVARYVMEHTKHSILAGELATQFAISMGFTQESLSTDKSKAMWREWVQGNCQPNFWLNVSPDPRKLCGPYNPPRQSLMLGQEGERKQKQDAERDAELRKQLGHDTISMIAIDTYGNIAVGTSSNGANHKVPGRVGDAPLIGAGGYADGKVGAAACTGDGDVMMRFLPSFLAVEEMRHGSSPQEAAQVAISRIKDVFPTFSGAIIVASRCGTYAAACHGMDSFPFSVHDLDHPAGTVIRVPCI